MLRRSAMFSWRAPRRESLARQTRRLPPAPAGPGIAYNPQAGRFLSGTPGVLPGDVMRENLRQRDLGASARYAAMLGEGELRGFAPEVRARALALKAGPMEQELRLRGLGTDIGRAEMMGRLLPAEEAARGAGFGAQRARSDYLTAGHGREGARETALLQPQIGAETAALGLEEARSRARIPYAGREAALGVAGPEEQLRVSAAERAYLGARGQALARAGETAQYQAGTERQRVEAQERLGMAGIGVAQTEQATAAKLADAQVRKTNAEAKFREVEAAGYQAIPPETLGQILTGTRPMDAAQAMQMRMMLAQQLSDLAAATPEGPDKSELMAMARGMLTGQPVRVPRRDLLSRLWNSIGMGWAFPSERTVQPPMGLAPAQQPAGSLMDIDEQNLTPEMRARIKAWAAGL